MSYELHIGDVLRSRELNYKPADLEIKRPIGGLVRYVQYYALMSSRHNFDPFRQLEPSGSTDKEIRFNENWLVRCHKWRNALLVFRYENSESGVDLDGLLNCTPCCFQFDSEPKRLLGTHYCRIPICVHCHARGLGILYRKLVYGHEHHPTYLRNRKIAQHNSDVKSGVKVGKLREEKKLKLYCAVFAKSFQTNRYMGKWLRQFKLPALAGAVAFRQLHLKHAELDKPQWGYKVIATSDVRKNLKAYPDRISRIYPVRSKGLYVNLLRKHFAYPPEWTTDTIPQMLRMYADHRSCWRYHAFGVCNEDHVPNRGWLDYKRNVGKKRTPKSTKGKNQGKKQGKAND